MLALVILHGIAAGMHPHRSSRDPTWSNEDLLTRRLAIGIRQRSRWADCFYPRANFAALDIPVGRPTLQHSSQVLVDSVEPRDKIHEDSAATATSVSPCNPVSGLLCFQNLFDSENQSPQKETSAKLYPQQAQEHGYSDPLTEARDSI